MQHALEHADDDQRGRHGDGAMHQIKQQEAKADAAGRHQQHRTPADPVGNAADERRRQQLAAGIAAEQQPDIFDGDAGILVRPQRKERHENAVRHSGREKQNHADLRRAWRARKSRRGGNQDLEKSFHVKAPYAPGTSGAGCGRSSEERVG